MSDHGGLYRINLNFQVPPALELVWPRASATYIAGSKSDLEGIQFEGLTNGPANVENGAFANLLFGIDSGGRLYAFDTNGVLQPIFVDGATSIQISDPITGAAIRNVKGLAFSTLVANQWKITPNACTTNPDYRQQDVGHGIEGAFDSSRSSVDSCTGNLVNGRPGLSSLLFGNGVGQSYAAPGGAYGTVVTNDFSLQGYAAADQPVMYFTYFRSTDPTLDTFNVYVSTDDPDDAQLMAHSPDGINPLPRGQWQALTVDNQPAGAQNDHERHERLASSPHFARRLCGAGKPAVAVRFHLRRGYQPGRRLDYGFRTAGCGRRAAARWPDVPSRHGNVRVRDGADHHDRVRCDPPGRRVLHHHQRQRGRHVRVRQEP